MSDGSRSTPVRLRAARRALQMPPDPPTPVHTHGQAHTHTRTQAETPGQQGTAAQCNRPAFLERLRKGYLTQDPGPRGSAGLPLRLSQLSRHWLWPHVAGRNAVSIFCSLSSMKSSPSRVCCRSWESLSKNSVGTPGPSGRYCFAAQGQAPGGGLPQKPSKVNQSEGMSMGLHGPASRKHQPSEKGISKHLNTHSTWPHTRFLFSDL